MIRIASKPGRAGCGAGPSEDRQDEAALTSRYKSPHSYTFGELSQAPRAVVGASLRSFKAHSETPAAFGKQDYAALLIFTWFQGPKMHAQRPRLFLLGLDFKTSAPQLRICEKDSQTLNATEAGIMDNPPPQALGSILSPCDDCTYDFMPCCGSCSGGPSTGT